MTPMPDVGPEVRRAVARPWKIIVALAVALAIVTLSLTMSLIASQRAADANAHFAALGRCVAEQVVARDKPNQTATDNEKQWAETVLTLLEQPPATDPALEQKTRQEFHDATRNLVAALTAVQNARAAFPLGICQ